MNDDILGANQRSREVKLLRRLTYLAYLELTLSFFFYIISASAWKASDTSGVMDDKFLRTKLCQDDTLKSEGDKGGSGMNVCLSSL